MSDPFKNDAVTEIHPEVDIAPEDVGLPVAAEGEKILEVDNVTLRFGGVVALDELGARFQVRSGQRSSTVARGTSYGELPPGGTGLLVDSYGLVSVAASRACAASTSYSFWRMARDSLMAALRASREAGSIVPSRSSARVSRSSAVMRRLMSPIPDFSIFLI